MASNNISQTVALRMYRRRDRLTVAAGLPGTEPEDILVEVTASGSLVISARVRGAQDEGEEILLDEWEDSYRREVPLPVAVNADLANMTYRNGVLVVALPIAETFGAARLRMETVAPAYGERVASHGTPVEPITSEEHHTVGGDHGPAQPGD